MRELLRFEKVTCVHVVSNLDSISWRLCKDVTASDSVSVSGKEKKRAGA